MAWALAMILGFLTGRWLLRRLLRLVFWACLAAAGALAAMAVTGGSTHAQTGPEAQVFLSEPLAPGTECQPSATPRGLFQVHTRQVVLPTAWPRDARFLLAGSADGQLPPYTDDLASVLLSDDGGRTYNLTLDYRVEHFEVVPLSQLDITALLAPGRTVTFAIEYRDLVAPNCSSTPYFLVGVVPHHEEPVSGSAPAEVAAPPSATPAPALMSVQLPAKPSRISVAAALAGGVSTLLAVAGSGEAVRRWVSAVVNDAISRGPGD